MRSPIVRDALSPHRHGYFLLTEGPHVDRFAMDCGVSNSRQADVTLAGCSRWRRAGMMYWISSTLDIDFDIQSCSDLFTGFR